VQLILLGRGRVEPTEGTQTTHKPTGRRRPPYTPAEAVILRTQWVPHGVTADDECSSCGFVNMRDSSITVGARISQRCANLNMCKEPTT